MTFENDQHVIIAWWMPVSSLYHPIGTSDDPAIQPVITKWIACRMCIRIRHRRLRYPQV